MFSLGAAAEGLTALLSFSSSLACPVHCHPSLALPLLTGLAIGILIGLALGFWIALQVLLPRSVLTPDIPARQPTDLRRRPSRLAGYLHE